MHGLLTKSLLDFRDLFFKIQKTKTKYVHHSPILHAD